MLIYLFYCIELLCLIVHLISRNYFVINYNNFDVIKIFVIYCQFISSKLIFHVNPFVI